MPVRSHLIHVVHEITQPCYDLLTDAGVDLEDAVDQLCVMTWSEAHKGDMQNADRRSGLQAIRVGCRGRSLSACAHGACE